MFRVESNFMLQKLLGRNFSLGLLIGVIFSIQANAASSEGDVAFEQIEWIQLMPEDDLAALMNPPESILGIADGAADDSVQAFSEKEAEDEQTRRFQQALVSTQVVETFKDKGIRIPGFLVPLQSSEDQKVTEFFIVPYFGACLHMPPPPPNQIIYAEFPEGVDVPNLQQPFWFEGKLDIALNENDLGTSAYQLALSTVVPYEG